MSCSEIWRECKFQNKAHRTFDTRNNYTPVQPQLHYVHFPTFIVCGDMECRWMKNAVSSFERQTIQFIETNTFIIVILLQYHRPALLCRTHAYTRNLSTNWARGARKQSRFLQSIDEGLQQTRSRGVSVYVVTAAGYASEDACARISIRLALFGCVFEIKWVRHIAIQFSSSSHPLQVSYLCF